MFWEGVNGGEVQVDGKRMEWWMGNEREMNGKLTGN